jgi:hypothetical protein
MPRENIVILFQMVCETFKVQFIEFKKKNVTRVPIIYYENIFKV